MQGRRMERRRAAAVKAGDGESQETLQGVNDAAAVGAAGARGSNSALPNRTESCAVFVPGRPHGAAGCAGLQHRAGRCPGHLSGNAIPKPTAQLVATVHVCRTPLALLACALNMLAQPTFTGQLAATRTNQPPPNLALTSGVGWRLARGADRPAAHRGTAAGGSARRLPALAAPGQLLPGLCAADVRPGALAAHGTNAAGGRRSPHDYGC